MTLIKGGQSSRTPKWGEARGETCLHGAGSNEGRNSYRSIKWAGSQHLLIRVIVST